MSRREIRRREQGELWYPPQYYPPPMPPPQYGPPAYQPDYARYPQPQYPPYGYERPRRRRRKTHLLPGPAKLVLFFVASWIPAGCGAPGLTILAWGAIGVWLTRRAFRSVA